MSESLKLLFLRHHLKLFVDFCIDFLFKHFGEFFYFDCLGELLLLLTKVQFFVLILLFLYLEQQFHGDVMAVVEFVRLFLTVESNKVFELPLVLLLCVVAFGDYNFLLIVAELNHVFSVFQANGLVKQGTLLTLV